MSERFEADRNFLRFLRRTLLVVVVLYAVLWFAILSRWEPGQQEHNTEGIQGDLARSATGGGRSEVTAHEFARWLLEGPDLPIMVPKVIEYDDSEDCCADPFVTTEKGQNSDGEEMDILLIDSQL